MKKEFQTMYYTIEDDIAVLTFNSPPQNRMIAQYSIDFDAVLDDITAAEVRAMVMRSDLEGIFSYGGYFPIWLDINDTQFHYAIKSGLARIQRIENLPFPVIAAVNGVCWGGGFETVLCCDMVLATPNATFNHQEKTLAITTLLGGIYRFAERAGKNMAMELAFTSEPFSAEKMMQCGVVNRIVEPENLDAEAMKLARMLADGPTQAYKAYKTLMRIWATGGIRAADEALVELSCPLLNTEDTQRALRSAKEALENGTERPVLKFKGK